MRLRASIATVSLAGTAIAGYLTYVHYAHVAPICSTGGCEKVQTSTYAELAGVPVAVLGVVAWAALIATAALRGVVSAFAGVVVAFVSVVFAGYLLWAQLGPIGAICQWCVGNDVAVAVVAVLCVARMLTEPGLE